MAGITSTDHIKTESLEDKNYTGPLIVVTTLFFMWGLITHLLDTLSPHLQHLFNLTYFQTSIIQFTFFGAYFLMSFPCSKIINKIGYKNGIIIGLVTSAVGAAMFYPAAQVRLYGLFLTALFTLASGITMLQVGANAYVSILGKAKNASSRLNMSQAFNSLGGTLAPIIGATFILRGAEHMNPLQLAEKVQLPYLVFGGIFILLALLIYFSYLPPIKHSTSVTDGPEVFNTNTNIWQFKHTIFGALAIFLYVGAEVAEGAFMIKFISSPEVGNMTEASAAEYTAIFYMGMLIGRFFGSLLMLKFNPGKLLGILSLGAVTFTVLTVIMDGPIAMWCILLVGFCNSIMFPTIFTLGIAGLGRFTGAGSALIIQAIVGGAIIPVIQGEMADMVSLQASFIVPAFCYLFICYYGFIGSKFKKGAKLDVVVPV